MAAEPGQTASRSLVVSDDDTAIALGSGSVAVLGTPRLLALCEEATVAAIDGHLGVGETTVGIQVRLDHIAPSPIGRTVSADATVEKVAGKKIYFTVSAHDDRGLVGAAKVTRVVVDEATFMARESGD